MIHFSFGPPLLRSRRASSSVDRRRPQPRTVGRSPPLAVLAQSILPALQRPPCMVSFSGGMDSSFVLAIAAHIARAAGLPAPIPITWRFTGAPLADESGWQEKVIASLAITEWE